MKGDARYTTLEGIVNKINLSESDYDANANYAVLKAMFLEAFDQSERQEIGDLFDLAYDVFGLAHMKNMFQARASDLAWLFSERKQVKDGQRKDFLKGILKKIIKADALKKGNKTLSLLDSQDSLEDERGTYLA